MMETEFVPYKQALVLKELGFDEPCFGYYLCRNSAFGIDDLKVTTKWIDLLPYDSSSCKTPLYQQAFRWFRENYDLSGLIEIGTHEFSYQIFKNGNRQLGIEPIKYNGNYEEAEFECLKKLIEIVKTK